MRGHLDFASRKLVYGWAPPRADGSPARVEILVDDVLHATALANRPREDLGALALGRTDFAFLGFVDLPREDRPLTVRVRVAGEDMDLIGSPMTLAPISQIANVDNPVWYRQQVESFLNSRFSEFGWIDQVFFGHQPLYGYGRGPCEEGWLDRYRVTHAILQTLADLDFTSLLDVGGCEGYKGALIRQMFQAEVLSADISRECCRMAEEIFGLATKVTAMDELSFADDAFDVVLCSESLEHVSRPRRSLEELIRVAAKAVVITVPHDPPEQVAENIRHGSMHDHVNYYDTDYFDDLRTRGLTVTVRKILNGDRDWMRLGEALEKGAPETWRRHLASLGLASLGLESWGTRLFDRLRLGKLGKALMAHLIADDARRIDRGSPYRGLVVVIEKRPCRRQVNGRRIRPADVLNFHVKPYTYQEHQNYKQKVIED